MLSKEMHEDIENTLGYECLVYSVKKWATELKRGRSNTEDNPRSNCPEDATSETQVNAVHCKDMADRRVITHISLI